MPGIRLLHFHESCNGPRQGGAHKP